MKRALITGASGQDGHYLAGYLRHLGYEVHAQSRRETNGRDQVDGVRWHVANLVDAGAVERLLAETEPDEIYNLAAVSRPTMSWRISAETAELNALVPQRICEWLVARRLEGRFFQATSSEIFGDPIDEYQNETTRQAPGTPYGITKQYAHNIVGAYRRKYDLHASSGILFNHESPRRPLSFASQKIAYGAAAISLGITDSVDLDEDGSPLVSGAAIRLGDVEVQRDIGFAGDYVEAMHLMLQQPTPDDFVVGTGESHSIREFCEIAFAHVGLLWSEHVRIDRKFVRTIDSRHTRADAKKMRSVLKWTPPTGFREIVSKMVSEQIATLRTYRSVTAAAKDALGSP